MLRKSVVAQLVSDVPVGILLSGGIDSTLVAALAAEAHPHIQTFTMSFDEESYDESRSARLVADRIGSDHHVEVCRSDSMRDVIPQVMNFMDEPLADASILPTFLLSRFTAKNVKVALGGDGGDELFAGNPTFQALRLRSIYSALPAPLRKVIARGVGALPVSHEYVSFDFKMRQFLRGVDHAPEADFFYWMGAFTDREKQSLLGPDFHSDDTFEDIGRLSASRKSRDVVLRCLYLCAKLYLQDGVLVKVDRASMANSLEVRAPYLDHELVEFAARIPLQQKMTLWRTKIILRQAAQDLLPSQILGRRQKRGFGVPIGRWILHDLRDLFNDYLGHARLKRDGLFNPEFVQSLLSDHVAGRCNNWRLLWTLLVFQLWRERWHT
jgi:asparagine synthase (glutamine-hydrolysing)